MSKFQRVQQWSAFARNWYIYDAKWQNPFHSAKKITRVLEGRHKGGADKTSQSSCDVTISISTSFCLAMIFQFILF